jgi:[ribosomal protein S18]-alanine N-acetyltransferase
MHIRRMTSEDLDRVTEIEAASFSDPWTRAMLVFELSNELSRNFVVEEEGRVMGFVIAWVVVDEAHILDLAVDPARRGCGLGRELTRAVVETGTLEGASYIVLEVRNSNKPAQRLYQGMGFQIVGRRPGYYRDNGEDAMVMMADLVNES